MHRRSFLLGLGAALAAPAIIKTPGLLMPVRPLVVPAPSRIIEVSYDGGWHWQAFDIAHGEIRKVLGVQQRALLDVSDLEQIPSRLVLRSVGHAA